MISLDWHHSNNVRFPHSVKNMQKIRIFLCLHVSSIVVNRVTFGWQTILPKCTPPKQKKKKKSFIHIYGLEDNEYYWQFLPT